ncbi:MAG: heavy metal-responsive transcriptional regulator [Mariprofundaceae bacterium]
MNIGKAARQADLSVDTVRYYERRGLLKPAARTASGYRQYTTEDIRHLKFIRHAKELGFTLEEIKQLLALRAGGSDCAQVRQVAESKADEIKGRIDKLSTIHDVLRELARQCVQGGDGDTCPILKSLEKNDE